MKHRWVDSVLSLINCKVLLLLIAKLLYSIWLCFRQVRFPTQYRVSKLRSKKKEQFAPFFCSKTKTGSQKRLNYLVFKALCAVVDTDVS